MKIETKFVRSKLGRRIVILFMLCALLPITILAVIFYTHVTQQFNEQSLARLRQMSKSHGMSILRRLELLDSQLRMIAPDLRAPTEGTAAERLEGSDENLQQRLKGLAVVTIGGQEVPLFGHIQAPTKLTEPEIEHLRLGNTLLTTLSASDSSLRFVIMKALDPANPEQAILSAEIDADYLWGIETMPLGAELCVLERPNRLLFSSVELPLSFAQQLLRGMTRSSTGRFDWEDGTQEYMAGYWSLFLKGRFLAPDWIVVLSESRLAALAPLTSFRKTFPLVVLMSIWVVLLLSLIQIRRNLVPLKQLQEGTKRIAHQDFTSRVEVTSDDEFQELASSFNTMARQLGRQFNTLTVINEIDRAILSASDTEEVSETLISKMRNIFKCDAVSVTLLDTGQSDSALTYVGGLDTEGKTLKVTTPLEAEELQLLSDGAKVMIVNKSDRRPRHLEPLASCGMKSFMVLPILVEGRLASIISLGTSEQSEHDEEDLMYARQLADQVAVAMANANLVTQRRELTSIFERYVSPEVASEILARRKEIVLAGEERTATVLFSDIRNFTGLTEGKPSAQVLSWLNSYFAAMGEIIMKNGGFLNKFMGDGMLVVFGVPLGKRVEEDACQAVRTALQMLNKVEELNAQKQTRQPPLHVGIGLHTGQLTAGNVGTPDRMEYSVIGETVNLASRLEEQSKQFEVGIVMSEETRNLVRAHFQTKSLGKVAVPGFSGLTPLYTIADRRKSRLEEYQLTETGRRPYET